MKVKNIPDKMLGDFWGMNFYADKELRHPLKTKPDVVYVAASLKGRARRRVVAHEKIEAHLMRDGGLNYADAHKVAEKMDKMVR